MSDRGLRTGELAERAGVNIQTLRYYERRGPLAAPARRPSGQRQYPEGAVGPLRTIKAAQRLGFTLAEIEELITLSEHRQAPGELHQRAKAKVAEIDAKIDQLTQMRQALLAVVAAECDSLAACLLPLVAAGGLLAGLASAVAGALLPAGLLLLAGAGAAGVWWRRRARAAPVNPQCGCGDDCH
jgi:DNA-binding transcriptional MerR regulator